MNDNTPAMRRAPAPATAHRHAALQALASAWRAERQACPCRHPVAARQARNGRRRVFLGHVPTVGVPLVPPAPLRREDGMRAQRRTHGAAWRAAHAADVRRRSTLDVEARFG